MNLISLSKQYKSQKEKAENTKETLCDELNKFLKPLFKSEVASFNHITVREVSISKDIYYYAFAGLDCIEVWETNDEEYARSYVFPTYFLKLDKSLLKPELDKLIKVMEDKRKEEIENKRIKNNANIVANEKREYARLKKKFEK